MRNKKAIFSVALVFWMIVIFTFSNQPANISKNNSDVVASCLIETVSNLIEHPINDTKKLDLIESTRFIVRKTAHFTIYFILNILAYFTFKAYGIKHSLIFSIIFAFIFACTDEIHQLFVFKREGKFFDVLIDTSGANTSGLLILGIQKLRKKKMLII